jgi:hypothetical protein
MILHLVCLTHKIHNPRDRYDIKGNSKKRCVIGLNVLFQMHNCGFNMAVDIVVDSLFTFPIKMQASSGFSIISEVGGELRESRRHHL